MYHHNGLFCSLEGPSGVGKMRLRALLAKELRAEGCLVVETAEPGGTALGEELWRRLLARAARERDPKLAALLLTAARRELIDTVIKPALAQGAIVLCARYVHSALVYQSALTGLVAADLLELHAIGCDDIWPDFTLLIEDDMVAEAGEDPTRLAAAFRAALRYTPHDNYAIIAGRLDAPTLGSKALRLLKHSEPFERFRRGRQAHRHAASA